MNIKLNIEQFCCVIVINTANNDHLVNKEDDFHDSLVKFKTNNLFLNFQVQTNNPSTEYGNSYYSKESIIKESKKLSRIKEENSYSNSKENDFKKIERIHENLKPNLKPLEIELDTNRENFRNIRQDDIIDKRNNLSIKYIEFYNEVVSQCDHKQNIYKLNKGKISKPLERKLLSLDQLLRLGINLELVDVLKEVEINSYTSYEEILKIFGDDTEAVFAYTVRNQEYKNKLFRILRSICEKVLIYDASLCDQYHHQIQNNQQLQNEERSIAKTSTDFNTAAAKPLNALWIELRNRSCQFLGPQVQEDVLHFVIRALGPFQRLTRRVLVSYIVFMLKNDYPKISKTSVGNVVQLLYRAGCFKVEKRDNDTSLIELKREYSKYESLRRQHDAQIIQIGTETGIRMTPEKWSQTLYGDTDHKSEMQSIIDKLQSVHTTDDLINSMYEKLDSYSLRGLSSMFNEVRVDFEFIDSINFEKKLPKTVNSLDDELDINENNFSNNQLDDDQLNEYFEELMDESFSYACQKSTPKEKIPNDQITWFQLSSCLQSTLKIVKAHADFSAKLMSMIIDGQNSLISNSVRSNYNNEGSNVKNVPFYRSFNSNKQPWSFRPAFQKPRSYQTQSFHQHQAINQNSFSNKILK